jgi:hypothetical protein
MIQRMIWRQGGRYGQIKLALKLAGYPATNQEAGR